jgi:hypothetical protein
MKKIIFCLGFLTICLLGNSQSSEKDFKIDSKTIKTGGTYVLIPSILGKAIIVDDIILTHKVKSTPYTITGSDTVKIITETPNTQTDYIVCLSDSIFVKSIPFVSKNSTTQDVLYNNSIKIEIPAGKFTVGNGDYYLKIKYNIY